MSDLRYCVGGYIDYRCIKSSIEVSKNYQLFTNFEFGYFIKPQNLMGINLNYNQLTSVSSEKEKDMIWVISGFYRRHFNRFFIKIGGGYGRKGLIKSSKTEFMVNVLSLDVGTGIIINVTENIKIPLEINYSYRTYYYSSYELFSKNQYVNDLLLKIGINYYFK